MNLFDILGPVMVGPSSSHTAGAGQRGQLHIYHTQVIGSCVGDVGVTQVAQRSVIGRLLHQTFAVDGEDDGLSQRDVSLRGMDFR